MHPRDVNLTSSRRPGLDEARLWEAEIAWRRLVLDQPGLEGDLRLDLLAEIQVRKHAIGLAKSFAEDRKEDFPGGVAKLTDDEVRQIRRRYGNGDETRVGLAKEYGVTESTIGRVVHRMAYRHVEDEG